MKVTGSFLSKGEEETNQPPLGHHYACCVVNVYSQGDANGAKNVDDPGKKIRRKYAQSSRRSVTGLSAGQVILGLMIIGCQLAPSYWQVLAQAVNRANNAGLLIAYLGYVMDTTLPGVWGGLLMLLTGIVGMVAVSKNARCLIVAHLVLNCFSTLFAIAVIVMASISLNGVASCKVYGISTYIGDFRHDRYHPYEHNYYWDRTTTISTATSTPSSVVLFGESFDYSKGDSQNFYCRDGIFTTWIVMELVIILSSLIAFGLTIGLIVKNSKALSLCCRKCCTVEDEREEEDDDMKLIVI